MSTPFNAFLKYHDGVNRILLVRESPRLKLNDLSQNAVLSLNLVGDKPVAFLNSMVK